VSDPSRLDIPPRPATTDPVRYWWVNQNETFRQETQGGYLWSPKRSRGGPNGHYNHFYENMREVAPGDLIFSFYNTLLAAIGIGQSHCYECPKPVEFGTKGRNWEAIGWRVDVRFTNLVNRIRPADHIEVLRPHLPNKYSPLHSSGRGNQVYLSELPLSMVDVIGRLIGPEFPLLTSRAFDVITDEKTRAAVEADEMRAWEEHRVEQIKHDTVLPDTERRSLIMARRGQGIFRERVAKIEKCCRLTRVERSTHLIASHAKPWRDSRHEERLDGENGLLLTPTVDHLFDRGFISFEDNGELLVSPVAHKESLHRMGVETGSVVNVGSFSSGQKHFLNFHRSNVFLARQSR
jgi:putative restriction endonuclease